MRESFDGHMGLQVLELFHPSQPFWSFLKKHIFWAKKQDAERRTELKQLSHPGYLFDLEMKLNIELHHPF